MGGFRYNEVNFLQAGYDVLVSPPPGDASRDFSWRFWKSEHDFLIVILSYFLSWMHGFRDKEVLLPTGNVIVISPLGGISHRFCWRNLKKRPQFNNHASLTYFAYTVSELFDILFWLVIAHSGPFYGCFGDNSPSNFTNTYLSSRKRFSLHQTASFELLCAKIGSWLRL